MENRDIPPAQTIKPMNPPPDSASPTSAMLKGDIDSGRTGDKNRVFDPGLSTLGTDDEAAGHPPSSFQVALARYYETTRRWMEGSRRAGAAHEAQDGIATGYIAFIVAVGAILVIGIASI